MSNDENKTKEIEEKIKKIISEQLNIDVADIEPESTFIEDLGADSLDTVELVMAFEDEFGIEIPDEEAEKIKTVKDVFEQIKKYTSKSE